MALRIETVTSRARLKPRREPYWHRVKKGMYVGFRYMTSGATGTWLVRFRGMDGKQISESLGSLEDLAPHDRFDEALARAQVWREGVEALGADKNVRTVEDACNAYLSHLRDARRELTARDCEARFKRWITGEPVASLQLHQASPDDFRGLRKRLISTLVKGAAGAPPRERSKDSVNRDMGAIRAAVNLAFRQGNVKSDFAWREALKPFPKAGRRRNLYLDADQRKQLITNATSDLAEFLQGMSAVPLRPGAVAALTVADFDRRLNSLRVGKDKHGQDRTLQLGDRVAGLFIRCCADKPQTGPIFSRKDGSAWNKDAWKHPVKAAAAAAGLPPETTAYTLRHSIITDLVHHGLDLLSVAQISGTSVAMIEQHYGHLSGRRAAAALDHVAVLAEA